MPGNARDLTTQSLIVWSETDSAAENIPPDHLTTKNGKHYQLFSIFSGQVVG